MAFGSTRRKNRSAEEDDNLRALLTADTEVVSIFGKCWDLHVRDILMTTEEENFAMIGDTVAFLREHGRRVIFDAEHFFDGYQANPAFAWEALASAVKAGGGGAGPVRYQRRHVPREVARITREVAERFPQVSVGIHTHNDSGLAVANSLMAVEGRHPYPGNLPGLWRTQRQCQSLHHHPQFAAQTGVCLHSDSNLPSSPPPPVPWLKWPISLWGGGEPYVGASAFAHKAGMHADGVIKNSASFEHINPERWATSAASS